MNLGIYLKLQHLKSFSLMALVSFMLVSCLPMQKETQCASNEAFNATRRKCVPVVGASTTNTVFIQSKSPENSYTTSVIDNATSHAVAVSDAYSYGYTIKWYEHYQDPNTGNSITTLVAQNDSNYIFNPTVKQAGQYILEAILFDQNGANQLDTVNWNIIVSNQVQPTLANPSPAATAYSYPTTITSASLSLDITNPDNIQGYYQFIIDNNVSANTLFTSATTISTSINPSTMSQGLHTVEARLVSFSNQSNVLANYVWVVNVVDPDLPVIQTANTLPPMSETITIVDGIEFDDSGWLDETNTALTNLCIVVDDYDKDSTTGSDIDVEFKVSGNSIGYGVRATNTDGTPNANANIFCLSQANLVASQTYFNLANPDVAESKSINVVTYRTGTTTQVESFTWNVVVRPKNIRPVISIDGVKTSSSLGCVASTTVHYTGCSMTQSVNYNVDTGDTSYSDAEDTDNVVQLGINLDYDPDITNEGDFMVFFSIKEATGSSFSPMNGNNNYTYSDCEYAHTDTSGGLESGDKYVCNLRMDAFGNNGPIKPGNYIITAYIRDHGDGDSDGAATPDGYGWGASPKESNTLTWEITVQERQSTGTIQIGIHDGTNAAERTFLSTDDTCTGPTTNVDENEPIWLCTDIRDLERDNFVVSAEMSNAVNGGYTSVIQSTLVDKSDNTLWTQAVDSNTLVALPINGSNGIPQWVVSGGSTTATVKVTVQDRPDDATSPICFTCDTATYSFIVTVNDFNPPPTFITGGGFTGWQSGFEGGHFVDMSANSTTVFAGMPFEIDVDTNNYTDASLYDGTNVSWQWYVSLDNGASWSAISNANSTNQASPKLVWTPDLDITTPQQVDLRLCLGDDGTGNELTDCPTILAPHVTAGVTKRIKEWQNITVFPATTQLTSTATNNSSGNELAQWYDATEGHLYTAYTSGTTIYVEKLGYNSDGVLETIHTLSFQSEDQYTNFVPTSIYNLSMTGIDSTSVMISYGVVETLTQTPQMRVRRIDTQNGKFSFHYCGFFKANDVYPNEHLTCEDLYDEDNATLELKDAADVSSVTSTSPGQLTVTFSSAVTEANVDLPLINSLGNTVIYRYNGTTDMLATPKIVGYCTAPACGDADQTAAGLAAAINNDAGIVDADVEAIAEEFYGNNVAPSAVVVIEGPNEYDYYDNIAKIAPVIGQVNVNPNDGSWFVPFSDASSNMQLGITRGDAAESITGLNSGIPPGNISLPSTGVNNQEIANVFWTDTTDEYLYIATKNSNSNLDLHRVDVGVAATLDASLTDVYTKGSYDKIDDLSISVTNSGGTDYVYVANTSTIISSSTTNLGMAIADFDLTTSKGNIDISAIGYEKYVEDVDSVHVTASNTETGAVFVSLTSNTNNTAPNNAYIIKLDYSLTGGILPSVSFNFHEHNYPALNSSTTVQDGAVWATQPYQLTSKGFTNDASTMADLDRYVLFFGFHESDTGNKIRTGFFNIHEEEIMTDDSTTSGNFPAIIGK
jgi:hypothetical protein